MAESMYPRGAVYVGLARPDRPEGMPLAVYAGLELRPAHAIGNGQTVTHGPVPADALDVSITGSSWPAPHGRRDLRYRSCGQNIDDARRIDSDRARRIVALWDRWHLNGLRAGCAHQADAAREINARLPDYAQDRERWALLSALPCPEGYRYGSAWLFEPVPDDVLAELRTLFGKPEGWTLPAGGLSRD